MLEAWQGRGRMGATSEAKRSSSTMWIAWTGSSGPTAQTSRSPRKPLLSQRPKTSRPCGPKSQGPKFISMRTNCRFARTPGLNYFGWHRCLCMTKPKDQKLEENVTQTLKLLKYPFSLSKSSLGAPGASTTWPHIRAALVWVVKIIHLLQVSLQYREYSQSTVHASVDLEIVHEQNRALSREQQVQSHGDRMISSEKSSTNKYLGDMYRAFMNMDDDLQNSLETSRESDYKTQLQFQIDKFEEINAVSMNA